MWRETELEKVITDMLLKFAFSFGIRWNLELIKKLKKINKLKD